MAPLGAGSMAQDYALRHTYFRALPLIPAPSQA
jgi:hypothetical protein